MVPNHHDHLLNQRGVVISSSSFTNSSNIMTITVMVVLVPVNVVLIIVVVIRLAHSLQVPALPASCRLMCIHIYRRISCRLLSQHMNDAASSLRLDIRADALLILAVGD